VFKFCQQCGVIQTIESVLGKITINTHDVRFFMKVFVQVCNGQGGAMVIPQTVLLLTQQTVFGDINVQS